MVNGEPSVRGRFIQGCKTQRALQFIDVFVIWEGKGQRFFYYLNLEVVTEGSPFTIRNHPVKTQTFDFLYIFACNTSQMQFPCNIRLSLAYNHDKQILSGFL